LLTSERLPPSGRERVLTGWEIHGTEAVFHKGQHDAADNFFGGWSSSDSWL
jgi:hypothetical protein